MAENIPHDCYDTDRDVEIPEVEVMLKSYPAACPKYYSPNCVAISDDYVPTQSYHLKSIVVAMSPFIVA